MPASLSNGTSTSVPMQWSQRVVVVVDLVESVRLMQADEPGTIVRWRALVAQIRMHVLPAHGGQLVKSLGDGLLLMFATVPGAVKAALAMHSLTSRETGGFSTGAESFALRIGVHVAEVVRDDIDIYGAGVNLAARVATLAQPGETVVTAEARDGLLADVDVEIRDLGPCFLKHLPHPVRAYRVGPCTPPTTRAQRATATRPTLLVAPFEAHGPTATTLADVANGQLITQLTRCGTWNVVSRLSVQVLRLHPQPAEGLPELTGADHIASGRLLMAGGKVRIRLWLVEMRTGEEVWRGDWTTREADLLYGESDGLHRAAHEMARSVIGEQLRRASCLTLPSLEAYAVMFRSVAMLHKTSTDTVAQAQHALEYLVERHPREAEAHAWAARSQVMQAAQHGRADMHECAARARDHLRRALDIQPDHALALAMEGLVCLFIERRLDDAEGHYQSALASNPNEPLAWLFMASVHAHRANGQRALDCVERASTLAPLDALGHYTDGVRAWAWLAAGDPSQAERFALRCMQADCTHRPTLTTLAQAQAMLGKLDEARVTASRLMAETPALNVSHYLDRFPGGATPFAIKLGDALKEAGVPA